MDLILLKSMSIQFLRLFKKSGAKIGKKAKRTAFLKRKITIRFWRTLFPSAAQWARNAFLPPAQKRLCPDIYLSVIQQFRPSSPPPSPSVFPWRFSPSRPTKCKCFPVYRSNCRKEHIENANVHWVCDRFKTLNGKIGHRKLSIGQIAG